MRARSTLFLLALIANASAQFSPPSIILAADRGYAFTTRAADLDGDGLKDIVFAGQTVAWYRNLGSGLFEAKRIILGTSMYDVMPLDAENDGDVDVIAIGYDFIRVCLNDGTGDFDDFTQTPDSIGPLEFLSVADVDGDGFEDLMGFEYQGIKWYRSLGDGSFAPPVGLYGSINYTMSVPSDIDLDGDIDLIVQDGAPTGLIALGNDGTGTFPDTIPIDASATLALFSVGTEDLDGDLDEDIYGIDAAQNVVVYLSNGDGTFTAQQTLVVGPFGGGYGSSMVDMDGDGGRDIVIGNTVFADQGGLTYQPMPAPITWAGIDPPFDMDGDGDRDLIAEREDDQGHRMVWYENLGASTFDPNVYHQYSANHSGRMADLGDMDGDGDLDVALAGGAPDLGYYGGPRLLANDGFGNFIEVDTLEQDTAAHLMRWGDVDSDGDADLVTARFWDGSLGWYANDGTGSFAPWVVIDENPPVGSEVTQIEVVDYDVDGDNDVLFLRLSGFGIHWAVNDGSNAFTLDTVPMFGGSPIGFMLADLSGDGYLDVSIFNVNSRATGINDGSGAFLTGHIPTSGAVAAMVAEDSTVFTFMMNGDLEYVTYHPSDSTFSPDFTIASLPPATTMFLDDVDGDADRDFYFPGQYDHDNGVCFRTGAFTAGPSLRVPGDNFPMATYALGDVDGSGTRDLLTSTPGRTTALLNYGNAALSIRGSLYADTNADGDQDSGEPGLPFLAVACSGNTVGSVSDDQGNYAIYTAPGDYIVNGAFVDPLWGLSSDSAQYHVTLTAADPISNGHDFGYAPLIDTTIVRIDLTSNAFRCSHDVVQWFTIANEGTVALQGIAQVVLAPEMDFQYAVPPPDAVSGDTLQWNVDSIALFDQRTINYHFDAPGFSFSGELFDVSYSFIATDDLGVPLATIDSTWTGYLTCAYDPNDKLTDPVGYGDAGAVDIATDHLDYTVRFQNTGNDTAYMVMIHDQLSSHLDPSSLEIVATSHQLTSVNIEGDRDVFFRFEQIMLPDSNVNEPASHGFVKFRAALLPGLPEGTEIENTAEIYFDYNPAVITNTVQNTLVDCDLFSATILVPDVDLLQATAGEHYQWFLNGDSIQGADEQFLFITGPGDYTVVVTSVYGCMDVSDPYPVISTYVPEVGSVDLAVIPNPSTSDMRLVCAEIIGADDAIEILDLHGRMLRTLRGNGTRELLIERGDLPAGIYMVRVLHEGAQLGTARVVMQ